MSTELQVMENTIDADVLADLTVRREPSIVLEEARRAAVCLKDVLDKKPQKVMMNDEQYLEFEDWQTVGKFYGVTCGTDADPNPDHAPTVEFVRFGEIEGFKATCVALHNGKVISRATAFCMKDEEKWGERNKYAWAYCLKSGGTSVEDPPKHEIMWIPNPNKEGKFLPKKEKILVGKESVPLYQLASMAQTRANSKVLRNVLSWVVVLAGYKPTPAEEILEAKHVPQQTEPLPTGVEMLAKIEAKGSVLEPTTAEVLGEITQQGQEAAPRHDYMEYLEKVDLAQSVKEWSEVSNEFLSYPSWTEEQKKTFRYSADQALKRLKEGDKKKR